MFLLTIPIHRFLNPAISHDNCVGIPILLYFGTCLALCLNSFVLNVKALVGSFYQEKALIGAFSVIVKSSRTFGLPSFEALPMFRASPPNESSQKTKLKWTCLSTSGSKLTHINCFSYIIYIPLLLSSLILNAEKNQNK